jgi:hypothetical protein
LLGRHGESVRSRKVTDRLVTKGVCGFGAAEPNQTSTVLKAGHFA